jgi:hypothetical protein
MSQLPGATVIIALATGQGRCPRPGDGPKPPCLHCGDTATKQRTRGLCRRCYFDAAVRPLYEPIRRRVLGEWASTEGDFYGGYRLPAEPTRAAPGTAEKIAVLQVRAAAKTSLHHPADARG